MSAAGGWRLAAGGWRLAAGGWRLAAGGWRLAAGGWRLAQRGGAIMSRRRLLHPGKGTSARMLPADLLRFLRFVTVVDHCWIWNPDACDANGYGQFWFRGQARWAHRVSYVTFRGPIRNGNDVDHHKCRNHSCVNPAHLCQKTRYANSIDGSRHRAAKLASIPF